MDRKTGSHQEQTERASALTCDLSLVVTELLQEAEHLDEEIADVEKRLSQLEAKKSDDKQKKAASSKQHGPAQRALERIRHTIKWQHGCELPGVESLSRSCIHQGELYVAATVQPTLERLKKQVIVFRLSPEDLTSWKRDIGPENMDRCEAIFSRDNDLYVFGRTHNETEHASLTLFKLIQEGEEVSGKLKWQSVTEFYGNALQSTAVVLYGGKLVVVGGQDREFTSLKDAFAYSYEDKRWTRLSSLPRPLNGAQLLKHGNELLLLAGRTRVKGALISNCIDVLSLKMDSNQGENWTLHRSHPLPCHAPAAASIGNQLVIAGGRGRHSDVEADVYFWSDDMAAWTTLPPLQRGTILGSLQCCLTAGHERLICVGGYHIRQLGCGEVQFLPLS